MRSAPRLLAALSVPGLLLLAPACERRPPDRAQVPLRVLPWRGAGPQARVTIVSFVDLADADSRRELRGLRAAVERHPEIARLQTRVVPDRKSDVSILLARAATFAVQRSRYRELEDELLALEGPIDRGALEAAFRKLGLAIEALDKAAGAGVLDAVSEHDAALLTRLRVRRLPATFANGAPLPPRATDGDLDALIVREQRATDRLIAQGTRPGDLYRTLLQPAQIPPRVNYSTPGEPPIAAVPLHTKKAE